MTKQEILSKLDDVINDLRKPYDRGDPKILAEAFNAIRDYIDKTDTGPANFTLSAIAEPVPGSKQPKDWGELWAYVVKELGLTDDDARYLWNNWKANGFTRNGKAIKDWKAAARAWKAGKFYPSQKQK